MLAFFLLLISALVSCGALLGNFYLLAAAYGVFRFTSRRFISDKFTAPVTLLKPLCGDEHDLKINLRSFCMQDYAVYQIVFGVQNADDAALSVIRELRNEFPNVDIAVVVDSTRLSHNMKVANLQNMFAAAKYDYLVMADSDMRVRPNYLSQISAALADPSVGAVTCVYRGISDGRFWSDMGCMHINYGFLPQAILGDRLSIGNGCFGATIAMRRDTLNRIGGFSTIGNVLADDHELGVQIRRKGKHVVLSPHVIDSMISEPDLRSLFKHETRWARTIHTVHPNGYIGSLFTHPVAFGVLGAALSNFSSMSLSLLAGILVLRLLTAMVSSKTLGLRFRLLWLLPLRDILSFAVFLNGFFYGTVKWRSNTFRVARDGQITLDGDLAA